MNGPGMEIKSIKNNRDYREALEEIDRLMDAHSNTSEGDRLDELVTLVEAWEEKHQPIGLAPNSLWSDRSNREADEGNPQVPHLSL